MQFINSRELITLTLILSIKICGIKCFDNDIHNDLDLDSKIVNLHMLGGGGGGGEGESERSYFTDFKRKKCIESDLFCRTPDLIEKYNYPVETHRIMTKDGFILVAHRIPYGRSSLPKRKLIPEIRTRQPIILSHALLCTSSDWLMNTPDKALAYILADSGFDVWLLNSRGNSYSNGHAHYTDGDSEYWDFSFHEMGTIDLPHWIDYILSLTRYPQVYFVGHSMGCSQVFITLSERPEYNAKIKKVFALAPALYITNSRYWMFAKLSGIYGTLIDLVGHSRFLPEIFRTWLNILGYGCQAVEPLCDNFFFFVAGYNPKQMNSSQTAIIASHTPDNVSSKTINHFLQIMRADRFQKYDYGYTSNGLLYNGQTTPPEYNLSMVTAPVVYFHSENDIFATPKDIMKSAEKLPNLKRRILVEDEMFTHVDFTYAKEAHKLIYERIVDMIINDDDKMDIIKNKIGAT